MVTASTITEVPSASPVSDMPTKLSDHARMKEHFSKQERVSIKIPKDRGPQYVAINGYSFDIAAGHEVKVPKQVAQMLRDAEII